MCGYPQAFHRWGKGDMWDNIRGHSSAVCLCYTQVYPQSLSTTVGKLGKDLIYASDVTLEDSGLRLDPSGEVGHLIKQASSLGHELANLSIRVHDRCVVASAECLTNFR
jgi:hypothetical protein